MEIKAEIHTYTKRVGEFNTLCTSRTDRSLRKKINKEIMALSTTLDHISLIDTFRAFHPKSADYTIFSSAYGTFPRPYSMLQKQPQ